MENYCQVQIKTIFVNSLWATVVGGINSEKYEFTKSVFIWTKKD